MSMRNRMGAAMVKLGGSLMDDRYSASVGRSGLIVDGVRIRGRWGIQCFGPDGVLKWQDDWTNLLVNQGLDHLLDIELSAGTQVTTWYIALLKATPTPAATWTYQNTMGTVNQEVTDYSQANRVTWVDGGVSGQSVDNSGSPAVFSINGTVTVGGAALVSNNVKNDSGAGPFMYAAGAFTQGDKAVDNGDTLNVTGTFTAADDGV